MYNTSNNLDCDFKGGNQLKLLLFLSEGHNINTEMWPCIGYNFLKLKITHNLNDK